MSELKIAVMAGVREHTEREPVELWVNGGGRLVVRSYNECRNNYTDTDLADLLEWARSGLPEEVANYGRGVPTIPAFERN